MTKRYGLAILAYVVPTFAIAYIWHLVVFEEYYAALQIYRSDVIVPFGFVAITIQSAVFAVMYDRVFASRPGPWLANGLLYAATGGVLSWTFTTISVAAKNIMASVPDFILIETAFTVVQWVVVGPLTALAFAGRTADRSAALPAS